MKTPKINYVTVPQSFMTNMNFLNEISNIISCIECNVESQDNVDNIYLRLVAVLTDEINSVASNRKTKQKNGKKFWNEDLEILWQDMRCKEKLFKKM